MHVETMEPASRAVLEEIPIIDIGPLLAGAPGALERAAAGIYRACTEIGFLFIVNHGMDDGIVQRSFEASRAFHALPEAEKLKLRMNRHQCGYMPPYVSVHNDTFEARAAAKKPQTNTAFKFTWDLPPDDPDYGRNIRFRGHNKWPDPAPPGMRAAMLDFHAAFEALAKKLLPPVAVALGLEPGYFEPFFARASSMTRCAHYPVVPDDATGSPGHTDLGFLTLIPPASGPGLEILTRSGQWIEQPVLAGAILVNTGNTLRRWSNDVFIATPHRVRPPHDAARFSNIFFLYPAVDAVMACVPSCQGPDRPAKYPPVSFGEFHADYAARNFAYAEDYE